MGGDATFASAKVKNAIGRIGIFHFRFFLSLQIINVQSLNRLSHIKGNLQTYVRKKLGETYSTMQQRATA